MIWVANLIVVAALYALTQVFKALGTEVMLGYVLGYAACYILFKCWRQDYADEQKPHFTER
jgi:hypothetical protein